MDPLKFSKLDPAAILPVRSSAEAAGLDLHSVEELQIQPGRRAAIKTGLSVAIRQNRPTLRTGFQIRHRRPRRRY